MAVDKKISQLTSLAQVDVDVALDVLPIVDTSAVETKKITVSALVGAGASAGLTSVDINSGTIDGTSIGASSASTGAFTTLTTSSTVTLNGGTANGVLYLNGSKVATSGSALVFDGTNFGINTASPGSRLDVKGTLRLSGSTSGYVGLSPAAAAGSTTYTLPSADGTTGQFLSTNGTGTLSWASASAGGGAQDYIVQSYGIV